MNEDQFVKLLIKLTFVGITVWVLWRVIRGSRPTASTHPNDNNKLIDRIHEAIENALGGSDVADSTAALIEERSRVAKKVRWVKRIVWVALLAYFVLVPLRVYFAMPSGFARNMALGQVLFIVMSITYTINYIVSTRMARASRVVLVLRRFREQDHRRTVLPKVVGRATAGIAVPITIIDSSFSGEPSPMVQILGMWLIAPITLLVGTLWIIYMPLPGITGIIVWFLLIGLFFWLLYGVKERLSILLGVTKTTENNFQDVLGSVFTSIRRRKGIYTGTMALKFPDSVWQAAIKASIVEADAVIVDVTEISESLEWELLALKDLVPPERVVLAWSVENAKQAADYADMTRHLATVLGDTAPADDSVPNLMSQNLFEKLVELLSREWIKGCQTLAYEKSVRQSKRDGIIFGESGLAVCIAIAHKES